MKISARNQLQGKVASISKGAVNAEVVLTLDGGETVVANITNSSVNSLGLSEGVSACAIIKASEVMIGKGLDGTKLSARNVLVGEISQLLDGSVNSEVVVRLAGGSEVVASITKSSVQRLSLKIGDKVSAIVKASNVMVGV